MGCGASTAVVTDSQPHRSNTPSTRTRTRTQALSSNGAIRVNHPISRRSIFRRGRGDGGEARSHREAAQIQLLQEELVVMEAFFQTLLGQAFAQMQAAAEAGTDGAPPASDSAIRHLPSVVVSPEDLVDEANRECCICFGQNKLGEVAARLPCGHLYHKPCVNQWLVKHCTCPICRYELPTDNEMYERGRLERMKMRKPRFRKHELDRMPVRELRDLAFRTLQLSDHDLLVEKKALVDRIIRSGLVELVPSPDPVEFKMSRLREMGVHDLKNAMADAGVFYDPHDVVEKEDMVQLFVNSGRLLVLPEGRESSTSMSSDSSGVEEVGVDISEEIKGNGLNQKESPSKVAVDQKGESLEDASLPSRNNNEEDNLAGSEAVNDQMAENSSSTDKSSPHAADDNCIPQARPLSARSIGSLSNRSDSELRSLAEELRVDVTGCENRNRIVQLLHRACRGSRRTREVSGKRSRSRSRSE